MCRLWLRIANTINIARCAAHGFSRQHRVRCMFRLFVGRSKAPRAHEQLVTSSPIYSLVRVRGNGLLCNFRFADIYTSVLRISFACGKAGERLPHLPRVGGPNEPCTATRRGTWGGHFLALFWEPWRAPLPRERRILSIAMEPLRGLRLRHPDEHDVRARPGRPISGHVSVGRGNELWGNTRFRRARHRPRLPGAVRLGFIFFLLHAGPGWDSHSENAAGGPSGATEGNAGKPRSVHVPISRFLPNTIIRGDHFSILNRADAQHHSKRCLCGVPPRLPPRNLQRRPGHDMMSR